MYATFHPQVNGWIYLGLKRKIEINKIKGVTISNLGGEFVIHVPDEYDYRYYDHIISGILSAFIEIRSLSWSLLGSNRLLAKELIYPFKILLVWRNLLPLKMIRRKASLRNLRIVLPTICKSFSPDSLKLTIRF